MKAKRITEETFALPNAGEVIMTLVKEGAIIDGKAQLKVFNLPNAAEILLEHTKHGHGLGYEAELKIFDLDNREEILQEYTKRYQLWYNALLKTFELGNAAEVILGHVSRGGKLSDEILHKVIEWPQDKRDDILLEYLKKHEYRLNDDLQTEIFGLQGGKAREIQLEYIKYDCLYTEAELKIFELENWKEILWAYTKRFSLSDTAQLKLFDLEDRENILLEYVKKGNMLCTKAQLKIFELDNREDILLECVKNGDSLGNETELKLFDLPDDKVTQILLTYIKRYRLSNEALLKVFDLDSAAEILLEYVRNGYELSDEAQIKVCNLPNAADILQEYVKDKGNKLCNEAQKLYNKLKPNRISKLKAKLAKLVSF